MKKIPIVLIFLTIFMYGQECSKEEIIGLSKSGYTKTDIAEICNEESEISFNNGLESWYFRFALGHPLIKYSGAFKDSVDAMEADPTISRDNIAIEIGIYLPLNSNYVIGLNINGFSDMFKDQYGGELIIDSNNYGASLLYYFKRVRDGFYLRGDIGYADFWITTKYYSYESDYGLGLAAGAGYSIESKVLGTGVHFEVLFTNYTAEEETFKSTQFLIGLMF